MPAPRTAVTAILLAVAVVGDSLSRRARSNYNNFNFAAANLSWRQGLFARGLAVGEGGRPYGAVRGATHEGIPCQAQAIAADRSLTCRLSTKQFSASRQLNVAHYN
jgi:hypothetical protein